MLCQPSCLTQVCTYSLSLQAIFYQLLTETRAAVEKRDSSLVGFYNSLVLGLAALWTACKFVLRQACPEAAVWLGTEQAACGLAASCVLSRLCYV